MSEISWIEWVGLVINLIYLVLLIKRSIWCWPAGIVGSGLSIFLFIGSGLYSEAILYTFYVIIGVYGWLKWSGKADSHQQIHAIRWNLGKHAVSILAGLAMTLGLGFFFSQNTDASRPFEDAFSTGFSFVASFLEAQRVLSGWLYWVVLNAFSIWLYHDRGLILYSGLSIVYTIMSVYGYYSWRKAGLATKD